MRSKRLKLNFWIPVVVLIIIAAACFLAPWIAPQGEASENAHRILFSPDRLNWMGTDDLGRDLFSRLLYGGRVSLTIAFVSSFLTMLIGVIYGCTSGWYGGWVDRMMMKIVEVAQSVPSLIVVILLSVVLQDSPLLTHIPWHDDLSILIALTALGWLTMARLVRGLVLQIKEKTFVEAARALGASPMQVMRQHVLRNILAIVLNLLAFQMPAQILFESFLSFIGLGVQPPKASWGVLIAQGWPVMRYHPHLIFFPALALALTTLALNYLSDALSAPIH